MRERGLKFNKVCDLLDDYVAPFAGAWIEILYRRYTALFSASLPLRERGLKYVCIDGKEAERSRSLCGSVD